MGSEMCIRDSHWTRASKGVSTNGVGARKTLDGRLPTIYCTSNVFFLSFNFGVFSKSFFLYWKIKAMLEASDCSTASICTSGDFRKGKRDMCRLRVIGGRTQTGVTINRGYSVYVGANHVRYSVGGQ